MIFYQGGILLIKYMTSMNPELLTGDKTIDDQHEELFELGEQIKRLANENKPLQIKQLYETYLDLLVTHFTYEEMLMLEVKYPADDFQRHRNAHRILQEIYLVAFRALSAGANVTTVLELFESRFLMHLWDEDLKLAQFIKQAKVLPSL